MTSPAREKISPVDTAWLRMDRPSNLMMICGVMLFRERVDFERLQAVVKDRWMLFSRFYQRPVQELGVASWETAVDFDINDHVVNVALPGKAGKKELQGLVSRLACTPLNPARPLWQYHFVDNYRGGSAIDRPRPSLLRRRHCSGAGAAVDDRLGAGRPARDARPAVEEATPGA